MSGENKNQIDNPQTDTAELPAAELEKISGGDKVAVKPTPVQTQTPTESVTLEYGKVEYKYTP